MRAITLFNQGLTMSSLEIAQLCHKRHGNVVRDMKKTLGELNYESAHFIDQYPDIQGKKRQCYQLPKNETLCLITDYCTDIRMKVIQCWQALENTLQHGVAELSLADQINEIRQKIKRKIRQIKTVGSQWSKLGHQIKAAKHQARKQLAQLVKNIQIELPLDNKMEVSNEYQ